jgi:hypothetical protein
MAFATNDNYYHLLGVTETATFEEIRQSYHDVCRRFHPDKQSGGGRLTPEQLEYWSALQTAWKCLSNEVRRVLYDLRRSGKPLSSEDRIRLQIVQKEQADRDITNMQIQYQQSLERERDKNGILVTRALFGDLRSRTTNPVSDENINTLNTSSDLSRAIEDEFNVIGPVIDVTVPIQCCVDGHRVILASGIGKSDMPGFYNPTIFHYAASADVLSSPNGAKSAVPCSLYVLYKFKGVVHEVNVSETDALWLPLRAHAVTGEKSLTGPAPPPALPTPVGSVCRVPLQRPADVSTSSSTTPWLMITASVIGLASVVTGVVFWVKHKRQ